MSAKIAGIFSGRDDELDTGQNQTSLTEKVRSGCTLNGPCHEKTCLGFPSRSNKKQNVQPQKIEA